MLNDILLKLTSANIEFNAHAYSRHINRDTNAHISSEISNINNRNDRKINQRNWSSREFGAQWHNDAILMRITYYSKQSGDHAEWIVALNNSIWLESNTRENKLRSAFHRATTCVIFKDARVVIEIFRSYKYVYWEIKSKY